MTTAASSTGPSVAPVAGAAPGRAHQPAPGPDGAAATPLPLLAGSAVLALAVVPAVLVLPHDRVSADTTLPFAGWLAIGVAGAVALDRPRWRRLGLAALLAAFVPAALLLVDALVVGRADVASVLWAVVPVWPAALAALAAAGWRAEGRDGRRWRTWLLVVASLAALTWVLAQLAPPGGAVVPARAAAVVALFVVAATVVTASWGHRPRPLDEPLLDLALVVGAASVAVLSGAALRAFARSQVIAGADVQAVVAGAVVLGLAVPGALRIRRDLLARRYGPGVLPDADVVALTADLGVVADPRSLLPQAARMAAAAGGAAAARVVLDGEQHRDGDGDGDDDDDPAAGESGWVSFPLVASGQDVGVLQVRPRHPDGLEERNVAGIVRLLPTLALVVRAVCLALAAQDSRSDLARQRERERARILQDLHDDLGPALAGMSMRVRAARTHEPSELLDALETGLAACRADLRRVVAGLTPPVLSTGDTAAAIEALVAWFRSPTGPVVELDGQVPRAVDAELAVVLYRCVAEGLTNAVRHADARRVCVRVRREGGTVRAEVLDDGTRAGPIVPGVGLTSLRARADDLGGSLRIETRATGAGSGTRLVVELPDAVADGGARP